MAGVTGSFGSSLLSAFWSSTSSGMIHASGHSESGAWGTPDSVFIFLVSGSFTSASVSDVVVGGGGVSSFFTSSFVIAVDFGNSIF